MPPTVRRIWLVLLCRLLISAGYSLAFPYFAVYLRAQRGFSLTLIGAAMAASLLVSALAQVLGGWAADAWGRRPVMLGGVLLRALFILALALAVRSNAGFMALVAWHWAGSVAAGFFDASSDAWVSDSFFADERLEAFSWLRTGGNLGWALGPALGGLLMRRAGYAELFFWTAAVYGFCLALLAAWLEESSAPGAREGRPGDWAAAAQDGRLWILGLGTVVIGVVMSQFITPFSLYSVDFLRLDRRSLGYLFSLNGAIVVLFQVPLSRWGRGRRLSFFLWGGCLLYAAAYASLALLRRFAPVAGAIAVMTAGEIAVSPALHAVAANLASERTRGLYLGALRFFRQIGWAVGPVLGGIGLSFWGGARPCPYWLCIGACGVGAAAVFSALKSRLSAREEGLAFPEPAAVAGP